MTSATSSPLPGLYFSYGSNMWFQQMHDRYPDSKFIGVGKLANWKWIVNTRGYVNIIPSPGDVVYGFVFILSESDEKKMDNQEGEGYTKRYDLKLDLLTPRKVDSIKPLIYIDVNRKDESAPYEEMLVSWNSGIKDGLENGIPEDYFEKYLRRFVPPT